ncbi:MAG: hypothetical protein F4Z47_16695 [Rhodospirillaceae bacterium]|nr:hypothetical protein [Rhodospirillaceae bacterium]
MSGIKSGSIEGDDWRQVKGRETGENGKSSNITTKYHTLGGERQVMAGIGHAIVCARIKSGAASLVLWYRRMSGNCSFRRLSPAAARKAGYAADGPAAIPASIIRSISLPE